MSAQTRDRRTCQHRPGAVEPVSRDQRLCRVASTVGQGKVSLPFVHIALSYTENAGFLLGIRLFHQAWPEFFLVESVTYKHETGLLVFPRCIRQVSLAFPHWDAIVNDHLLPLTQAPEVKVKYACNL